MHLKTIEIQGFKSFPNKTEIELNRGITTIVGPNGSGKSNISDAVRWVLGEQSLKTLRGERTEDIIFSGTDFKRPLNYAQVSIIFDNSDKTLPVDYPEVEVTRRAFRHGENEYLLNRNAVRLKDIRKVFLDTGLGKGGYALIGQGQIDDVLTDEKEGRRSLLEEAAGISKNKYEKNEAERRIKRVEENLVRIEDSKVTNQRFLEQLEYESMRTLEYNSIVTELKEAEIQNAFNAYEDYQKKTESIYEKLHQLKKYKSENEVTMLEFENLLGKNRKASAAKEIKKSEQEKIFQNLLSKYQEKRTDHKLKVAERKNKENELTEIKKNYQTLVHEISQTEEKINELNAEIQDENTHLLDFKNELNHSREFFSRLEMENKNLLDTHKEHKENMLKYQSLTASLETSIQEYNERISSYNQGKLEHLKTIKELQEKINKSVGVEEKKEISFNKTGNELREVKSKINGILENVEKLNALKDNISSEMNSLNYKYTKALGERDLLIKSKENYLGYYHGTKKFMNDLKDKKENFGILNPLGELIKVEKEHVKAIEKAIGSRIQNIVIERAEIIDSVKKQFNVKAYGAITFLPIDTINKKAVNDKAMIKDKGFIDFAINLVKYEPYLEKVVAFVLGETVVFDNYLNALVYAKKNRFNKKIVTLSGEVINFGGSITIGGSSSERSNLLGRDQEFEILSKQCDNYEEKIDTLAAKMEVLQKDIESKVADIENLKNIKSSKEHEYNNLEQELSELKSSLYIANKNLETEEIRLLDLENNVLSLEQSLSKVLREKNEVKERLVLLTNDKEIELRYKEYEKSYEATRTKLLQLEGRIQQAESVIEIKEKQRDYERNRKENQNTILLRYKSDIKSQEQLIPILMDEETLLKQEELDLEFSIRQIKQEIETSREDIFQIKLDLDNHQQEFEALKEKKYLNDLEIVKIENKITNSQNVLEEVFQNLKESYGIDKQNVLENYSRKEVTATKARIKDLKNKISKLGPINPQAIEQYHSLLEEYEAMEKQRNDLLEAKHKLNELIKNIEVEMKDKFRLSLNRISTYFSEIFSELFNGGEAKISIEQEGDLLESEINIYAQPPGKRLQHLSLLSGGEKALTAVALLFALLKEKPSPFCILDEIDAALDEANIIRYTNFLMKLSKETQFIIITHRKGTMEIADRLYGVTMEEKGISKVIPLELSEYKRR